MTQRTTVVLSDVLDPLRPYLVHQSWRCDGNNRNRFPASEWPELGGCHCGLVTSLQQAGVSEPEAFYIAETITEAIP